MGAPARPPSGYCSPMEATRETPSHSQGQGITQGDEIENRTEVTGERLITWQR